MQTSIALFFCGYCIGLLLGYNFILFFLKKALLKKLFYQQKWFLLYLLKFQIIVNELVM